MARSNKDAGAAKERTGHAAFCAKARSGLRADKRAASREAASAKGRLAGLQYTSSDIARLRNGAPVPAKAAGGQGVLPRRVSMRKSNALYRREHDALATKVFVSMLILLVLVFLSLGIMGAAGQNYTYTAKYMVYTPVEVAQALFEHAYNAVAVLTHWFPAHTNEWILENVPGYWAIVQRAGVVGITLICAVLLAVSGMLYQNVFHNPIAGPGMLGAGSGVSLGMMLMVALYSAAAPSMIEQRYQLCYGLGAAVLIFVLVAGKKLSGRGRPYDIVTMLLIGSILSQLLGFIVSYMTLFVMDEADYAVYYTMSQMLTVDTSAISWAMLGIASAASFIPVFLNRYKLNALAFDEQEARMLGIDCTRMRFLALLCGAIMILAAQIHVGMVSLVSLIVPFLSRSLFGCEFNKQLIGNVCIGTILLLVCRDITDLIPFVGDGLAIGSIMSVVAMPLFVVVMARQMRGWE